MTHPKTSPVAAPLALGPDRIQTVALVTFGTLGILILTLMPSLLGALADTLGASAQRAGVMASLELGGTALGGAIVLLAGHYFRIRQFLMAGIVLMTAGAASSAATPDLDLISAAWVVMGIGGGLLAGAAMRSAASFPSPDRIYGQILIGQMSTGFLAFLLLPSLIGNLGLQGAFLVVAALCLCAAPLLRAVPQARAAPSANPFSRLNWGVVLVCTSFLLHYVANSMLWSYADRIGVSHHVAMPTIEWAFAGSMISGAVGAIIATVWGRRFSLASGIYTGIGLISLAATLFLSSLAVMFVAAVLLMNLAIMFVVPAYLGFLAQAEGGEDAVTLGNLASFVGLMAGPAVGSRLIVQGSFTPLAIAGLVLFVLAYVIARTGVRAMQRTGSGTECDPGPNTMVRGDLKS